MLVGQILAIIFWLTAWAWSASVASIWLGGGYYYRSDAFGGALAGCAGLGAVAWYVFSSPFSQFWDGWAD